MSEAKGFAAGQRVNCFTRVGTRTAESCFFSRKNRRAGAQTEECDGTTRVEGEKCIHGPWPAVTKMMI